MTDKPHEETCQVCAAHGPLIIKIESLCLKVDRVLDLLRGPLESPTEGGMRQRLERNDQRITALELERMDARNTWRGIIGRVASWAITAAIGATAAILWGGGK